MTSPQRFSPESIRRRRIVLRALSACVPTDKVLPGLQYWEEHFGHESSLLTHIRRNVGELCDAIGLPDLRLQVYNQLFLAMVVDDRELPPDPLDPDGAQHVAPRAVFDGAATQPSSSNGRAAGGFSLSEGVKYAQTLSAFLLALRERQAVERQMAAHGRGAPAFAQVLEREWQRARIPTAQVRLLQRLADGHMPSPFSLDVEQARMLVHIWYLALAETIGPVEADRLFGQVLSGADEIERMCGASPRLFL